MQVEEELIETVNVAELNQLKWPFFRLLSRHFVEEAELGRYLKQLLARGRWSAVRVVPHVIDGRPSNHIFDVYGQPRADDF